MPLINHLSPRYQKHLEDPPPPFQPIEQMSFDVVLPIIITGGIRTILMVNIRNYQTIHINNILALVILMIRRDTRDLNGLTNQENSRRENGLTSTSKTLKEREMYMHMRLLALPMKLSWTWKKKPLLIWNPFQRWR